MPRFKVEFENEKGEAITMILEHETSGTILLIEGPSGPEVLTMSPVEFEVVRQFLNITVPGRKKLTTD